MAKEKIEQPVSDTAQIESERAELSAKIQALISDLAEIGRGIEDAEQSKTGAKASYDSRLDAGDEDLMSEALSRIRQANGRRENLINSLVGFSEKISAIRTSYSELMSRAVTCRNEGEKKLEVAKKEFEAAKTKYDGCFGLLSELNSLDRELARIKDASLPQEPRAEKISGRIEGVEGNV